MMTLEELKIKWEKALNAFSQEDYTTAGDVCRFIVKDRPNFPQAWYLLAAMSVKFKQHTIAKEYLDSAKPYLGENYDLILESARLYYVLEDYQTAKNLLLSLPHGQESPTILIELARTLWQLGEYSESIGCFAKANELAEEKAEFALPLLKAYLSFGDKQNAIKVCKSALEKDENNPDLLLYYHLFLWDRGFHQEVIEKLPMFPDGQIDEFNFFAGAVNNINGNPLDGEMFFHPLLQLEKYRPKVKAFNELFEKYKKKDFFVTFPTDLMYRSKEFAIEGDVYEFGVYKGRSTSILSTIYSDSKIYGFDSFAGLPEQWTSSQGPGAYNAQGKAPNIKASNVRIVKGWYKDTLDEFFAKDRKPAALIHIDCDLHSSTLKALDSAKGVIQSGTLILFDDFVGYEGYENHEYKAFNEFVEKYNVKFEMLNYAFMGREVLIRILEID